MARSSFLSWLGLRRGAKAVMSCMASFLVSFDHSHQLSSASSHWSALWEGTVSACAAVKNVKSAE